MSAYKEADDWLAANGPGGWIDDLRKDAERYQWLAKRLIAIDIATYRRGPEPGPYIIFPCHSARCANTVLHRSPEHGPAIVFAWPKSIYLNFGDLTGSIDDAMAIEIQYQRTP